MPEHSPLPWSTSDTSWNDGCSSLSDSDGNCIVDGRELRGGELKSANAEFIARACNAHYDLVAACEAAEKFIAAMMELYGQGLDVAGWHQNGNLQSLDSFFDDNMDGSELKLLRAALINARSPTCFLIQSMAN